MERADPGKGPELLKNQPYDESLEVDGEEVPSVHSPTPRGQSQSESSRNRMFRSIMSANSSSDEFDEDLKPLRDKEPAGTKQGPGPNEEDEDEEEEEDDSDDDDDTDDDDDPTEPLEGVYDPADYANLPVSTEIKELFQYIIRYTPQTIELDHSLKPFIPDFIPAVGDIDAFLKVPRPDGKPDDLGLLVLDEPSVKQSDPTVLSLWLSEETKQHGAAELKKVTSVASPQDNPRAVDSWVDSISALHRSKPPASVQYHRPVPDIDSLMQEWAAELEDLLGRLQLPPARLDCSLSQYADIICSLLDIPVYGTRIQSLHLLFSLYLEFRDSQHFTRRT
ncbi:intraflagellar transport protein 46 homolog isoform X2 [Kryptolebias marmoratus]|uniref:Intraflagellar transport protein 46 homolog n=2 Tax=Kryptolebias marmoratus TaxID=37003 RepID=A0A3Q3FAR0_KRYMA|nr:intraflagellar transport protein 46 homolog isoform X2 [Kryptolebias marmoratus]